MISRSSSGLKRKSRLEISVFMQTDLPEPVAPAISRCGALARSRITGLPATSLPSTIGMPDLVLCQASVSIRERMKTASERLFGTSMPTTLRPGIGASTRTLLAERFIAILSAICSTFFTLTPSSSEISKRMMRGPAI